VVPVQIAKRPECATEEVLRAQTHIESRACTKQHGCKILDVASYQRSYEVRRDELDPRWLESVELTEPGKDDHVSAKSRAGSRQHED
jgi:hypothetical protein